MSLSMYADEQARYLESFGIDGNVEPGAFKGMLGAGAKLIPRVGAQIARGAALLAAPVPIALDAMSGGFSNAPRSTLLQDMYFGATVEPAEKAVEHWSPAPHEVGWATEAVYSVFGTIAPILLAPIPTIASLATDSAREVHAKPGVSLPQALGVGAVAGLSQYAGVKAALWGRAELEALGIAVGFNWGQGILTRGVQNAILTGTEAQKDFQPFGLKEQAIDVLMALAMTPAFRRIKSVREEGQRDFYSIEQAAKRFFKGDAGKSPFEAELSPGAKAVNSAMREWADNAKPSDVDALLVMRQTRHLAVDSAPGLPTNPRAVETHVDRLKAHVDAMLRGDPLPPEPVPRETIDQFTTRAGQELGEPVGLAPEVALLQRAYIEQGSEAGRAMLDELADQVPDRPEGFVDQVHQQLTERAQQYKDAETPFAPDPQREADAMEITRGMQEAAPRIAREEGLPEGPTILLPIEEQLKAHLMETGYRQADGTWRKLTQAEASQYIKDHAALYAPTWKAMADLTEGKMSPEQLAHRYLADVKMRAPAPSGALEQRMTPAQHIADYKPTVEKLQYGGTTYNNDSLALTNSKAYGKGEKGERRAFRIMDKTAGSPTDVGFVILEIDRNGKFAALRNIEIREDIRSKGLGENVVATLVAHNGPGYRMDVVDITHGGKIDTPEDALPFWKKVGTQLKNYSRDSNVQMDGMLSLEDYLGARSGQRTATGNRGRQATNLQADGGANRAAGARGAGAGPTAADRAELARLNGDALFQSTWYHSALSRAIDNVPTKAQPAQGWKDWLKGQIQKGAIKADEVKYTGLEEYLDLQPGKITKEQLQTFMQEGGVRVEEVELGLDRQQLYSKMSDDELAVEYDRLFGGPITLDYGPDWKDWPPIRQEAIEAMIEIGNHEETLPENATRFTNFQLPGAKEGSYRELALVLPVRNDGPPVTPEQVAAGARLPKTIGPEYQVPQGHSMGAAADINRLAHIRFNERTGPNGERVLFIEEIQSDWAQAGKKHGFGGPEPFVNFSTWAARRGMSKEEWQSMWDRQQTLTGEDKKVWQEWKTFQISNANAGLRPPPGPFVVKTDAWVGLSLKRMIRYAAENGFDQIAWTTGAQQADRYDLSKQVREIAYDKKPDGTYHVSAEDNNGRIMTLGDSIAEKDLPDHVGKELAQKIADGGGDQRGGWKVMSGIDLKVGGEGMKGFYDKIVPSVAKDVMKKLGGGKVEQIELRNQREDFDYGDLENATPEEQAQLEAGGVALKQQGITITPEMRTKAMESQALFQRAGHMSPHTFNRFDHSHMSKGEGAQVYGWGTYLFTKKEVGDWYYNNFQRAAERDASLALVDMDQAREWMDDNLPSAMRPAADLYMQQRNQGVDRTTALEKAMALWKSTDKPGDPESNRNRNIMWAALQDVENRAVRTLTSNDNPAYKTPDGKMVHASQAGDNKAMADAIGQVAGYGYARAALTFDNLITQAQRHLEHSKSLNDVLRKEAVEQQTAPMVAVEAGKSGWGDLAEPGERRYKVYWLNKNGSRDLVGDFNAKSPDDAIEQHRRSYDFALKKYDENEAANQQRVADLQRTRALVDEITEQPTPVPINVAGTPPGEFSYLLPDTAGGQVVIIKHSVPKDSWEYQRTGDTAAITRQGFQTKEEALAHAVSQVRTLKPGYEVVKPTPKPVRKYTVEAPENDVLLNWEVKAGEQPRKVKDALAKQGVLIADEAEIRKLSEDLLKDEIYDIENDDSLSAEAKHADMLSLPTVESGYYRDRVMEFINDQAGDDARMVLDPQISGRQVYVELMKMNGYDPARDGQRLDGKNTKYAAAASQLLATAGTPGHRYYDGNSRSGRKKDQTYNFVIYDEKAMDIVNMEQDQARGYLSIGDDRKMTIGFLQSTDPSTPIHEPAHFFLEMLDDLAKEHPKAEAEMQVLFKEWGVDRQTWDTWSLNDKRFFHEQFARSWEAYIMTNKAPTPELRGVFRRFRDWLVAIYETASTLNVKVSQQMRELFDRLHGSQLRDPSTDPAATAAASGNPPPPRPGVESQPPGSVDPFADIAGEPTPYVPKTLNDQDMREHLRYMTENEVGWAQVGGKNLTGQTGTVNFSTWIPKAEWWTQRPDNIKKLKESEYEAAVAKALVGDPLKPIEQRAVNFMLDVANRRLEAEHTMGKADWLEASKAVHEAGLETTTHNVVDADAVAIANQIDEGMVERLAIQYDADDAGFMAEIRRIIDDHENPEAPAGSPKAGSQPAPEVPAAGSAPEASGQPARTATAGSDRVDLLAQEADRFVLERPDLTMEIDMPDGTTQLMTAAQYLADVRESAAMARDDIRLFEVAAQCLLGAA